MHKLHLLSTWIMTECHHFILLRPFRICSITLQCIWPLLGLVDHINVFNGHPFWPCGQTLRWRSIVGKHHFHWSRFADAAAQQGLHFLSTSKWELQHFLPCRKWWVSRWDLAAGILAVSMGKKRIQGQGEKEKVKRKAREETGVQIRNCGGSIVESFSTLQEVSAGVMGFGESFNIRLKTLQKILSLIGKGFIGCRVKSSLNAKHFIN